MLDKFNIYDYGFQRYIKVILNLKNCLNLRTLFLILNIFLYDIEVFFNMIDYILFHELF